MTSPLEQRPPTTPREISPEEFLANAREELRHASEHGTLIIRDATGRVRMEVWVPQDDEDAA